MYTNNLTEETKALLRGNQSNPVAAGANQYLQQSATPRLKGLVTMSRPVTYQPLYTQQNNQNSSSASGGVGDLVNGGMSLMNGLGSLGGSTGEENSGLLNTVLRDEWGFRGMALTDFFRNNGHGFMNADAALANGVDVMLSTFDGEENNVANPEHPTSVLQMRNACKNVMYTVVSSWAYDDGNVDVGMEGWKKAAIAIDAVLALGLLALEAVVLKGYKKRRKDGVLKENIQF